MRIVLKVGTSTLAHPTGLLNIRHVEHLCKVVSDLKNAGHEIILVSSGAIGMGVGKLQLPGRPADMPSKQAAAAVGQCELMYTYDKLFGEYNHTVAQMLADRGRHLGHPCVVRTSRTPCTVCWSWTPCPSSTRTTRWRPKEIAVGDNDTLGAIVASCAKADLLVLFSDIHGLYTADPKQDPNATLIHRVEALTPEIKALAGTKGSELATGGMVTKIHAAEIATEAGVEMIICHGAYPESLYDIVAGKEVGTRFCVRKEGT